LGTVNNEIRDDQHLGKGFRIGHSFFCDPIEPFNEWYTDVIDQEIAPLLEEYFDDRTDKIDTLLELLAL
jgi:5-methylcytosine-specific restriction enzyme B